MTLRDSGAVYKCTDYYYYYYYYYIIYKLWLVTECHIISQGRVEAPIREVGNSVAFCGSLLQHLCVKNYQNTKRFDKIIATRAQLLPRMADRTRAVKRLCLHRRCVEYLATGNFYLLA